ncbi:M1 family metallopeptidase [Brevundimonas sp. A19_0]|uniref:M1 family metallopeptidase n=1 Tax=Brevundimonas sp. A19_0 TaxID=2821087 RepID=UPI001AD9D5CB|nr:M1 family metallopeptidase [Brevundimonas sp. A19_0]MBO9502086.1 M1 family metallopeptidase [Brevundimonas sp. A19_0]
MRIGLLLAAVGTAALMAGSAMAQVSVGAVDQSRGTYEDAFRQFEGEGWPSPNDYRTASGAPGYRYWQQQVDYVIDVRFDEDTKSLSGSQRITYHNNSPDTLTYVWILLDQQDMARGSMASVASPSSSSETYSRYETLGLARSETWEGGFSDIQVKGTDGRPLNTTQVDALLRVDLPRPLAPGETFVFDMSYRMPFAETAVTGARSGYECFPGPTPAGNCIFQAAQWFPRLAAYSDYEGWHTLPFLGSGEFPLEFGNYEVSITVPADHVVAASGELQNGRDVLTREQQARMAEARRSTEEPVYVVTPDEALAREQGRSTDTRTWRFRAENVRDFAWASSRGFVWDAMAVEQDAPGAPTVMAMSFYTKEARPMWDTYSTRAVAHAIDVYSSFTFPYPYPTAQSVNGPVGGMEYPMITFNGARPTRDAEGNIINGDRTKYALVDVIIHEIGHIYFPMIVNSDERQWTWMDEGINTFLEYQATKLWDPDFPASGEPRGIVGYMTSDNQVPLMTRYDTALNQGNIGYRKPGTALVVLRETVMGRELFDRAFQEYARRWQFKRATPYDFFRTMEESSGMDLDWFWRGWFYSTDHVDISVENVIKARPETDADRPARRPTSGGNTNNDTPPVPLTVANNSGIETVIERNPGIDAYDDTADHGYPLTEEQRRAIGQGARDGMTAMIAEADSFDSNVYRFTFKNVGGVVMPIILKLTFEDGTSEIVRIPAEIWRFNNQEVSWQYVTDKTLVQTEVDPNWETADADRENNYFPRR